MNSYLREIKTASIDATRLTLELTDGFIFTVPLTSRLATGKKSTIGKSSEVV